METPLVFLSISGLGLGFHHRKLAMQEMRFGSLRKSAPRRFARADVQDGATVCAKTVWSGVFVGTCFWVGLKGRQMETTQKMEAP